ncbi:MAG: transposase zinc-binding domain-containing protein [Spirochaetes bacterium]|nr:transposase zinc-binding domain-containing protein [Spirochaetota bacterium]
MYICDKTKTKPAYKPGLERWSLYKGLWIKYWKEFQNSYDETFKEKYGELTQRHKLEVRKLISCGKFQNGFNRYYCQGCMPEQVRSTDQGGLRDNVGCTIGRCVF